MSVNRSGEHNGPEASAVGVRPASLRGATAAPLEELVESGKEQDLVPRTRDERIAELARDIAAAAYLKGDFVLSSGIRSSFYLDKYLFETKPGILRRVARLVADVLPPETERIAGPELGAVPIATAVALETGLPFVIVKKDVSSYGTAHPIEGDLYPSERVTVIEDVVTTASRAIWAAKQVSRAGANVVAVVAVIDRGEGGGDNLAAAGHAYLPLLKRSDLGV